MLTYGIIDRIGNLCRKPNGKSVTWCADKLQAFF